MTTVSFQTDEELKEQASKIFEALGLNLTTALNMFLRQTVIQHKYPCSLELEVAQDAKSTYGPGFFALFGQGRISALMKSRKMSRLRMCRYEVFPRHEHHHLRAEREISFHPSTF